MKTFQTCPECREKVKVGARRCKHCGAEISPSSPKKAVLGGLNTFRAGFISGVMFTAVLVVLVYLHFLSP